MMCCPQIGLFVHSLSQFSVNPCNLERYSSIVGNVSRTISLIISSSNFSLFSLFASHINQVLDSYFRSLIYLFSTNFHLFVLSFPFSFYFYLSTLLMIFFTNLIIFLISWMTTLIHDILFLFQMQ